MKEVIFIEGMQCNHCKMAVEEALKQIDGIEEVQVELEQKKAVVYLSKPIEETKIKDKINEIGFEVIKIEKD